MSWYTYSLWIYILITEAFPGGSDGKESAHNKGDPGSDPWILKISWKREWQLGNPMNRGASELQTMGSQRVRQAWATNTQTHTHTHIHYGTISTITYSTYPLTFEYTYFGQNIY